MLLRSRTTGAVLEKVEEYKERSFTYGKIYRAGMQALSNGSEKAIPERRKMSRAQVPNRQETKSPRQGAAHADEKTFQLWNPTQGKTAAKTHLWDAREAIPQPF